LLKIQELTGVAVQVDRRVALGQSRCVQARLFFFLFFIVLGLALHPGIGSIAWLPILCFIGTQVIQLFHGNPNQEERAPAN
jgi:hypothetical protein